MMFREKTNNSLSNISTIMRITIEQIQKFLEIRQPKKYESGNFTPAGVLVPLFTHDGELHVLLTQRTQELEHHKGQVCFPGGTMQNPDLTPVDTALRETEEEIGIPKDKLNILGLLDDFRTPSGFLITPVVAYLTHRPSMTLNIKEVSEVFDVPLSFFLNLNNERVEQQFHAGKMIELYFYRYGSYEIWGATAAMLRSFLHEFIQWLESKKPL